MKSEDSMYEKIDFEWNNFVLDTLIRSREKIFSSAEEIVVKRKICEALKRIAIIDEDTHEKLIKKNNLLDSIYLVVTADNENNEDDESLRLQESIKKWIDLYLD